MKKYYLIGVFVFLAGVFAYHFLAANQAEEQIDKALQEQTNNPENHISVQYSSIDVSPFSGNIAFDDITIVRNATIQRSKNILVDLGYWDFLKIYIGGLQFGLEHLNDIDILLMQPTHVNRNSLLEIKFDTLNITYSGNAWDAIRGAMLDSTLTINHLLLVRGKELTFTQPNTRLGTLKSKNMNLDLTISKSTSGTLPGGRGNADFETISWTPTSEFQQNYSFFIKGFGFEPDSIPIQTADFSWEMEPSMPGIELTNGEIITELCKINLDGSLITANTLENSRLEDAFVEITNFSDQFAGVLENMEKLLNISLPKKEEGIVFRIGGTLKNPVVLNN